MVSRQLLTRRLLKCLDGHGIAVEGMYLFGSTARGEATPESDIDVLVEFEPGKTPGFAFFGMQDELSEKLGRPVDLNTPGCLSKYFRDQVVAEARPLYVQA